MPDPPHGRLTGGDPLRRIRPMPSKLTGRSRAPARGPHAPLALLVALAASAALLMLLSAAPPAGGADEGERPTIYKWIDQHGVAHYTTDRDRIPRSIRNRIERVPRGGGSVPAPPPATASTPPVPSPPESAAVESEVVVVPPDLSVPAAAPAAAPPPPSTPPAPEPMGPEPPPPATRDAAGIRDENWATANVPELLVLEDLPAEQAGIDPKTARELASLDEEIAELEAEIARNETRLLALLAGGVSAAQSDNPELRAIAENLPTLQSDLAVLRERRESLLPAPGS